MTNTKLFLFIGTSLSLIPSLTSAQCVATQDCATLGYTETSCSGGSGVKCPFGNKWACFKSESEFCNEYSFTLSCTGTGYSGGVGKACNGKYNYCSCVNGYTWDATNKICGYDYKTNCVIGALYYSDGTCSDKLESSKTLLGVVIYEKSASENGWIIAYKPSATKIMWSNEFVNIDGILTTTSNTNLTDIHASCTNTEIIATYGNSSKYPAVWAAKNYSPTGTPSGKSWCLPSAGLLNHINNAVNFSKVNAGITTAGGTTLGNVANYGEIILSSSAYSIYEPWNFFAATNGNNSMFHYSKNDAADRFSVRPVMAF